VALSISFPTVIEHSVLIIGDVGAGKTQLTVRLVEEAIAAGKREQLTIIDMAPTTRFVGSLKVGGQLRELAPHLNVVRYLAPSRIETPRLSARSPKELQHLVTLNQQRIAPLLHTFLQTPSSILFINDVSLYLQSGSLTLVTHVIEAAETCIVNGYYGQSIQTKIEDPVSRVERALMDRLSERMDIVVTL
jgi:GTPase SAR1 family protein